MVTFTEAIVLLKQGKKIRRTGWAKVGYVTRDGDEPYSPLVFEGITKDNFNTGDFEGFDWEEYSPEDTWTAVHSLNCGAHANAMLETLKEKLLEDINNHIKRNHYHDAMIEHIGMFKEIIDKRFGFL